MTAWPILPDSRKEMNPEDKMVVNFISYKVCKLFVCLMCFQMFFVCINHFVQFTPFLLDPFKSIKEELLVTVAGWW
jgi:hypothetical protein